MLGHRNVSSVSVAYRRVEAATADRTFAAELDKLLRAVPTNHESRPDPVSPRMAALIGGAGGHNPPIQPPPHVHPNDPPPRHPDQQVEVIPDFDEFFPEEYTQ